MVLSLNMKQHKDHTHSMLHRVPQGQHQFYPHMLDCCKGIGQSIFLQSKENFSLHISMAGEGLQSFGRVSGLRPHLPGLGNFRRLYCDQTISICKLNTTPLPHCPVKYEYVRTFQDVYSHISSSYLLKF